MAFRFARRGARARGVSDLLVHRSVEIYSDNTGAEASLRKGTARSFDHCMLVHAMWKRLAELRCTAWVGRVPTEENLADLPSRSTSARARRAHPRRASAFPREEYDLLKRIGGRERPPTLDEAFMAPSAWRALSLRNWYA